MRPATRRRLRPATASPRRPAPAGSLGVAGRPGSRRGCGAAGTAGGSASACSVLVVRAGRRRSTCCSWSTGYGTSRSGCRGRGDSTTYLLVGTDSRSTPSGRHEPLRHRRRGAGTRGAGRRRAGGARPAGRHLDDLLGAPRSARRHRDRTPAPGGADPERRRAAGARRRALPLARDQDQPPGHGGVRRFHRGRRRRGRGAGRAGRLLSEIGGPGSTSRPDRTP